MFKFIHLFIHKLSSKSSKANPTQNNPTYLPNTGNTNQVDAQHLPPITLIVHSSSDLNEPSNIASRDQRWELTILLINILARPADSSRVLRHLETGDGSH